MSKNIESRVGFHLETLEITESSLAKIEVTQESVAKESNERENQDKILLDQGKKFAAVFDGMGGAGEAKDAGRLAAQTAENFIKSALENLKNQEKEDNLNIDQIKIELKTIIKNANLEVLKEAKGEYQGMGTTVSLVYFYERHDDKIIPIVVNLGDSRVYHKKEGQDIEQVTVDDNPCLKKFRSRYKDEGFDENYLKKLQKELNNAKLENDLEGDDVLSKDEKREIFNERFGISQCLGKKGIIPSVTVIENFQEGDKIIITSDGVHDFLTDKTIGENSQDAETLVNKARSYPEIATSKKSDDSSAIVIKYKRKIETQVEPLNPVIEDDGDEEDEDDEGGEGGEGEEGEDKEGKEEDEEDEEEEDEEDEEEEDEEDEEEEDEEDEEEEDEEEEGGEGGGEVNTENPKVNIPKKLAVGVWKGIKGITKSIKFFASWGLVKFVDIMRLISMAPFIAMEAFVEKDWRRFFRECGRCWRGERRWWKDEGEEKNGS